MSSNLQAIGFVIDVMCIVLFNLLISKHKQEGHTWLTSWALASCELIIACLVAYAMNHFFPYPA
jgi:hypothetical protein